MQLPTKVFEYDFDGQHYKVVVTIVARYVAMKTEDGGPVSILWFPPHLWRQINAFVQGELGG